MNLATSYCGLELSSPLLPGASPLADDLDTVRRLEDAGAAAIVMRSLFEEQLVREQLATLAAFERPAESFAEATGYLPEPEELALGPEEYLEQLASIKRVVAVPVIASLNGTTRGGWLEYARLMERAGADALELNVYRLATDPLAEGEEIERDTLEMIDAVARSVAVPVAVKLSPFYTSLAAFARRAEAAGAAGLVLFNRFYQADLDLEAMAAERRLELSSPSELLLRLRWLAILSPRLGLSLAVTGGVHSGVDALKAIAAGAHVVQVVSALLSHGPGHLAVLRRQLVDWLDEHGVESLASLRGSLSLARCPDPEAYERANYIEILHSWRAGPQ